MKKLFYVVTIFVLIFSLFCFVSVADSVDVPETFDETEITNDNETPVEDVTDTNDAENVPSTDATEENTAQNENKTPTTNENEIIDQLLGIVTDGEIWAKIGVTVLGALALILTLKSGFTKFMDSINVVIEMIKGKATKEEAEIAMKTALSDFEKIYKNEYEKLEKRNEEISGRYNELSAKYDKQTAVLTLTVLQLVKSPNARTQIMSLISESKEINGDVMKVVESIAEEIKEADAAIPKIDTPNLDAIVNELKDEKAEETEEEDEKYMILE